MFYSSLLEPDVLFLAHAYELALFASLKLIWAITTGGLFRPATGLPHKDIGIPFSTLLNDTACELASMFSTLSLSCKAPIEAVSTIFCSLLV